MTTNSTKMKLTLKVTSFILRMLMNVVFYILVIILIINVSKSAFGFAYQLYGPVAKDPAPGKDIVFQVKKGENKMDIASKLELYKVIDNKYSFYVKTEIQDFVVMPGTYVINSSMTYDQILTVITDYSQSIVKDEDSEAGSDTDEDVGTGTDDSTGDDTETNSDSDANTGSNDGTNSGAGTEESN